MKKKTKRRRRSVTPIGINGAFNSSVTPISVNHAITLHPSCRVNDQIEGVLKSNRSVHSMHYNEKRQNAVVVHDEVNNIARAAREMDQAIRQAVRSTPL